MITYRFANSADAEQLLKTRYHAVVNNKSQKYSLDILQSWAPVITSLLITEEEADLANQDRVTIVAEEVTEGKNDVQQQTKMVGLCTLGISEGLLKQCYVLPTYNGLGIARSLVNQIETVAKERRIKSLKLSSSLIATGFYQKMGYVPLNNYDYVLGNGLTMECVMMEKSLIFLL